MRLRVGVVGLGDGWEHRHRPALLALTDRFDVRAFCADVALKAEQAAQEFKAVAVDGYRALTCRQDIDAVLVLAPDWYGPLPILAACESGKAIYWASALDIDPSRAEEIKNRVEEAGVAFMAELPRRHAPATIRLKELIATRLGKPELLFCHERLRLKKQNDRQRRFNQCPVQLSRLMELVDWCCYVVGEEPTAVFGAHHEKPAIPGEVDYRMMSLDFSRPEGPGKGALAQISCGQYLRTSWHEAISFRPPAELQVCCEKGVAFIDLPATVIWFDEAGRHLESLDSERPVGEQLLTQFHRAVTSLIRKTSDLEDAYRALRVVTGAQQSFEQGKRISLLK